MRVKLKRVLSFVSAVVICGVSCVTSWFSVPVSAIGVFSPFNFYQLYQMLHGLLLGDGGGNSQTFGEWLEKNMTRTVGSGNSKQEFLITPGMKLDDMISEASMRLMLGAACSDGGIAGVSKMKDLVDSWTEVYDTSDIGEIGESGGSSSFVPGAFSVDGRIYKLSADVSLPDKTILFSGKLFNDTECSLLFRHDSDALGGDLYMLRDSYGLYVICLDTGIPGVHIYTKNFFTVTGNLNSTLNPGNGYYSFDGLDGNHYRYYCYTWSYDGEAAVWRWFDAAGISIPLYQSSGHIDLSKVFSSDFPSDFNDIATSDDFIGPVYAMPAAKQLITDTGTLSGLRLDVQTEDGTPDISAALDHAGVDSVDDLVSGVAAGTIPMSQVYEDMRVVPYVLTDVETGQVVTDLNVSVTDAKTKAVALDKSLSIPKDISAADAYQVTGKTWDPEMSKYKLPLFQFFPFCLPWDIYEVLTLFDAEPVAPKFTIPVGQFFTRFSGSVDTSKAADQKAVVDLGSDSWQSTFKVIRALECAAIIIGLCLTAVLLIHGGR